MRKLVERALGGWFPNLRLEDTLKRILKVQFKIPYESFQTEVNFVALVVAQYCMAPDLQSKLQEALANQHIW